MAQTILKSEASYESQFNQLPELLPGMSDARQLIRKPSKISNKNKEAQYIKKLQTDDANINNLLSFPKIPVQTSFATQHQYYSENFGVQEIILLILLIMNSLVFYNYQRQLFPVIFLQTLFAIVCSLLLIHFGLKSTTIPLLLVLIATIICFTTIPFLSSHRHFMFIPLIYPFGLNGVIVKLRAIYKAIKKESVWMFLSICFLFYFFGYISYLIFWQSEKYFKSPIHSSISLLQLSTFDGTGKIISQVAYVSGLALSFGILVTTIAIFQTLFNINQALIIKYVHEKSNFSNSNSILQNMMESNGISLNLDGKHFKYANVLTISILFIIPFQSQFVWLYCLLSSLSTISVLFDQLGRGKIFGFRSVFNMSLFIIILYTAFEKYQNICFLLCSFRIFLIKQVQDLWKKIIKVLYKIYPMLSLLVIFYLMFAMTLFCFQKQSFQKTLITGFQVLAFDDWTSYIRTYPWYMKIILLVYMLIGSHILLNSLVSQAFDELEDNKDSFFNSRSSDSLIEELNQLSPQKKFVSILKQLKFQGLNGFKVSSEIYKDGNQFQINQSYGQFFQVNERNIQEQENNEYQFLKDSREFDFEQDSQKGQNKNNQSLSVNSREDAIIQINNKKD